MRANGFTLVEMLVALAVFGLLSAGGIALLRSSLANQESVTARLDRDRGAQRVIALFQADVGQAIARPLTGVGDPRAPSLEGGPDSLSLVRDGWANPGGHPRSSLQRVTWSARAGSVARAAHLSLDGSDPAEPAMFAQGVREMRFRYRLADGRWVDRFAPTEQQLLPAAIEMRMRLPDGAVVVLAALPPRGMEPNASPVLTSRPAG